MILIYASKVNLGKEPVLSLMKDGLSIPHLPVGVDTNSSIRAINLTEPTQIYFYLIKLPDTSIDGNLILPTTLETDFGVTGAISNKVHWLLDTSVITSKFTSVCDVSLNDDGSISFKELDSKLVIQDQEMDWLDYYCAALRDNMFIYRKWILDVFSLKRTYKPEGKWEIGRDDEKGCYYTISPEGARINLKGVPTTKVPVGLFRKVTAYKGDLANIKGTVETTTGELLINAMAFCYKYGDFQTYKSGKIMPKDFHAFFASLLKAGQLTDVQVMSKAIDVIEQLSSLAPIAVPAASRATISPHPEMRKLITEEVSKLSNKQDIAKLAEIDAKGVALDKEHIKGSPSETFFIKGKMHSVVRKKTDMMYGSETDLDGNPTITVTKPLSQGWSIEDMPSYVNAVRAGSNSRGLKTAEGGSDMKETIRMLSAYKFIEEDCGSKHGHTFLLNKDIAKRYVGRYLVGSNKPLTEEELNKFIGKEITLRDFAYCKSEGFGLCHRCGGEALRGFEHGLALEASNLGAVFQDKAMQAAHGSALTTKFYNMEEFCT